MYKLLLATILVLSFAPVSDATPISVPQLTQAQTSAVEKVGNKHWKNKHYRRWGQNRYWNRYGMRRSCGYYGNCYRRYNNYGNYYRRGYYGGYNNYYTGYYRRGGVTVILQF
jgi:hypothetical protein